MRNTEPNSEQKLESIDITLQFKAMQSMINKLNDRLTHVEQLNQQQAIQLQQQEYQLQQEKTQIQQQASNILFLRQRLQDQEKKHAQEISELKKQLLNSHSQLTEQIQITESQLKRSEQNHNDTEAHLLCYVNFLMHCHEKLPHITPITMESINSIVLPKMIDKGYRSELFSLGLCYQYGAHGFQQNREQALSIYETLASQLGDIKILAKEWKDSLKKSSNVKSLFLNLWEKQVHDTDIPPIVEILKVSPHLQELNLLSKWEDITTTNLQSFGRALTINTTLKTLSLRNIRGNIITDINFLADTLRVNTTLRDLTMESFCIFDSGTEVLVKALKENFALKNLHLRSNEIGDIGAEAIGNLVQINTSLIQINLWGNPIGFKGLQCLSKGLEVNTTLQYMMLDNLPGIQNEIGQQAIGNALELNTTLTSLVLSPSLSFPYIIDLQHLGKALQKNSSLRSLKLNNFKINDAGKSALEQALNENIMLNEVEVGDSYQHRPLIHPLLERNTTHRQWQQYMGSQGSQELYVALSNHLNNAPTGTASPFHTNLLLHTLCDSFINIPAGIKRYARAPFDTAITDYFPSICQNKQMTRFALLPLKTNDLTENALWFDYQEHLLYYLAPSENEILQAEDISIKQLPKNDQKPWRLTIFQNTNNQLSSSRHLFSKIPLETPLPTYAILLEMLWVLIRQMRAHAPFPQSYWSESAIAQWWVAAMTVVWGEEEKMTEHLSSDHPLKINKYFNQTVIPIFFKHADTRTQKAIRCTNQSFSSLKI